MRTVLEALILLVGGTCTLSGVILNYRQRILHSREVTQEADSWLYRWGQRGVQKAHSADSPPKAKLDWCEGCDRADVPRSEMAFTEGLGLYRCAACRGVEVPISNQKKYWLRRKEREEKLQQLVEPQEDRTERDHELYLKLIGELREKMVCVAREAKHEELRKSFLAKPAPKMTLDLSDYRKVAPRPAFADFGGAANCLSSRDVLPGSVLPVGSLESNTFDALVELQRQDWETLAAVLGVPLPDTGGWKIA